MNTISTRIKRKVYVWRMLKAIDKACFEYYSGQPLSRTFGLRAIRRFEKANDIEFDPQNKQHIHMIQGQAYNELRSWRWRRIIV